jgi:hypothetical protein
MRPKRHKRQQCASLLTSPDQPVYTYCSNYVMNPPGDFHHEAKGCQWCPTSSTQHSSSTNNHQGRGVSNTPPGAAQHSTPRSAHTGQHNSCTASNLCRRFSVPHHQMHEQRLLPVTVQHLLDKEIGYTHCCMQSGRCPGPQSDRPGDRSPRPMRHQLNPLAPYLAHIKHEPPACCHSCHSRVGHKVSHDVPHQGPNKQ